jgi:hypothetical protein
MVLFAFVATPFVASVAQGSQSDRDLREQASRNAQQANHHDAECARRAEEAARRAEHVAEEADRRAAHLADEALKHPDHAARKLAEEAHKQAEQARKLAEWALKHLADCDTPPPPPPPPPPPTGGQVQGTVFFDLSFDGVRDPDESGIENWLIMLSGPVSATTTTDAAGNYSFTGLPDGTYTVCEAQRFAWIQTLPQGPSSCTMGFGYTFVVAAGQVVTGLDFGNVG